MIMNGLIMAVMLAAASMQDPDSSALVKLEDDWARALVRRDTVTFQRLLAPGFVYSENDQTMTREDVLRSVGSGSDTVTAAANEDVRIHRFGTTALVTGWLVVRGRGESGSFDRRYRYTDVWMKRGGRWQIIGAHDYLAPPSP
jgi:ketosteroid isomerase-like protein